MNIFRLFVFYLSYRSAKKVTNNQPRVELSSRKLAALYRPKLSLTCRCVPKIGRPVTPPDRKCLGGFSHEFRDSSRDHLLGLVSQT